MRTNHLLATAMIAGALAFPAAAMAQGGGGGGMGGGGGAAGGGAAAGVGGEAANPGTAGLPSQRLVNTQASGRGAALTISGSGVRLVQQALNRLGYNAGPITGNWDRYTVRAMQDFQAAHGLEPTGNLTISAIAALGLWNNLIGNPIGNGNRSLVGNATGAPPPRGNVGGGGYAEGGRGAGYGPAGGYGGGYGAGGNMGGGYGAGGNMGGRNGSISNLGGGGGGGMAGLPSQRIIQK